MNRPLTSSPRRRVHAAFRNCALSLLLLAPLSATTADARGTDGMADVRLATLPQEGRIVHAQIIKGGPFAYERDGVAFGNREKMLPAKPRGYYHEYTVPTPGEKSRGARRIVCGGPARAPEACYYSDDHYRSFRRIIE